MPGPFRLPAEDVRPSQLYLNGRKLALATEWFDFDDPEYDSVPVVRIDGNWTLTDGHTRAFLAVFAGAESLHVHEDTDDLPRALYAECVGWCHEEDVTQVRDLFGRVVNATTFERVWVDRCQRAAERLGDG
ncbi:histone acetyltransferase [Halomarina oriensis]|uniref:Histone acetyltransferase n=1 Tax=Halomarina oriensis TaxID=671145 RepID=A0A6B0GMD1_9EURY|nr:histone acetyltransferase [Halomarina oriensis]MWG33285.1 histone acetyltransferase [Halomarina oriensis]